MKINITKKHLSKISLSDLADRFPYQGRHHVNDPIGQEFHVLYAYFSSLFNGIKIADIGTRTGNSAIALSYNENNHVDSYDVNSNYYNIVTNNIKKENITFHLQDILSNEKILEYKLISLDVDPHDGKQERRCFKFLQENNWKGLVLLDDIGPNWIQLHQWWNEITLPKWDLTKYGHASGTGLVDFTQELELTHD